MVRAVGHLDKRTRTYRCQACARRRMKCDGHTPCSTCARLNKTCVPQHQGSPQDVKFVTLVGRPGSKMLSQSTVPSPMKSPPEVRFQDHFVAFLFGSHFTESFSTLAPDFLQLLQSSGPLLDIARAIGALEAGRKGSVRMSSTQDDPNRAALLLYGKSIRAFGQRIAAPGFQPGEKTLWTTFLLGLFELMSKASSTEAWSMHMIQGMGQVVRYMPSAAKSTRLTKELLQVFRCLEINRAILYGADTDLSLNVIEKLGSHLERSALLISQELMLEASLLSHQMFKKTQSLTTSSLHHIDIAASWALVGVQLLDKIRRALSQIKVSTSFSQPFERLARANCCALCLYICRNFTYFPCFVGMNTPKLTDDETEELINIILDELEEILEKSVVNAILLLFPLRVAGASSRASMHKIRIEKALGRVYTIGFAVSKWVITDLKALWEWQENHQVDSA